MAKVTTKEQLAEWQRKQQERLKAEGHTLPGFTDATGFNPNSDQTPALAEQLFAYVKALGNPRDTASFDKNKETYMGFVEKLLAGEPVPNPIFQQAWQALQNGIPIEAVQQARDTVYSQIGSGIAPDWPVMLQNIMSLAGSGQTGGGTSSVTTDPATGKQTISTGDPALDKILNEYLASIEQELGNDPTEGISVGNIDEAIAKANELFTKLHGPAFEAAKGRIEKDFGLRVEEKKIGGRELAADILRTKTRAEEITGVTRQREARNFQNAIAESSAAFASAGRAFGGGREEREKSIEARSKERLSDLERQFTQSLEDLQTKAQSQLGTGLEGLPQFGTPEEQFGGALGKDIEQIDIAKAAELGRLADLEQQYKAGKAEDILGTTPEAVKYGELFL